MEAYTVSNEHLSQSVLSFLHSLHPETSWEREFDEGNVRVGRHFVGRHYILRTGDRVIHDPEREIPEPEVNFRYQEVYEDEYLSVIDKPAPIPIHPTGTYFRHTLIHHLHQQGKPWCTIHRLDNETSGAFLLAKKSRYVEKLSQALIAGKKTYLVLVYGLTPLSFSVDLPLGKKQDSRIFRRQGHDPQGKKSHTRFRRIASRQGEDETVRSLIMAQPYTGRTHQIRAHLAESGFPIVGDKIYGKDENYFLRYLENMEGAKDLNLLNDLELRRQFLHCRSISITHPYTGKELRFKTDLPPDLIGHWESLKSSSQALRKNSEEYL